MTKEESKGSADERGFQCGDLDPTHHKSAEPIPWAPLSQRSREAVLGNRGQGDTEASETEWRRGGQSWPRVRVSTGHSIYHVAGQEMPMS